jgi:hypothetical protein
VSGKYARDELPHAQYIAACVYEAFWLTAELRLILFAVALNKVWIIRGQTFVSMCGRAALGVGMNAS